MHCINSGYLKHNRWTMTEITARIESVYRQIEYEQTGMKHT
jgi:hypothetical protein